MDIFGHLCSAHHPQLPIQRSPPTTSPVCANPLRESGKSSWLVLVVLMVMVMRGEGGEAGVCPQELGQQQKEAGWELGLSRPATTASQPGEQVGFLGAPMCFYHLCLSICHFSPTPRPSPSSPPTPSPELEGTEPRPAMCKFTAALLCCS